MKLFLCCVLTVLCGVSRLVSPNIVSEMVDGVKSSAQFASDPAQLISKIEGTAEYISKFPNKSKLPQRNFTWAEVKTFNGKDGKPLYLVFENCVYDVEEYSKYHPAGPEPLQNHAGQDATAVIRASGMTPELYRPLLEFLKVGDIELSERDNSSGGKLLADSIKSRFED